MHAIRFPQRKDSLDVEGVESYARQSLFATRLFYRRHRLVSFARHPATQRFFGRHPIFDMRRSCQRRLVETYARQMLSATFLFCRRYLVVSIRHHLIRATRLFFDVEA